LSAVTGRAEIVDAPEVGQIGGTFAGSPVACAAGLAVLDVIEEENIVERSAWMGEKIQSTFRKWQEKYDVIGDVRGLGPMCAIELVKDRETKEPAADLTATVVNESWQHGLISLSASLYSKIHCFLPNITMDEKTLDFRLTIIEKVIKHETKRILLWE